jgi:tripartite-type tricarboxylate transporter receptor subunit TctC
VIFIRPEEKPVCTAKFFRRLGTVGLLAALSSFAHAQSYPSKPVRLIVGFGPGGATDVIGRFYAQKYSEVLKTPVIVDNRPSAAQLIAIKTVMAAAPDGYTIFFGTGSAFSQGPGVRTDLAYDPLKDLSLIGLASTAPGVIAVTPKLPVGSVRELIDYSKQNPSKLNYASSGIGSASHLQAELLMNLTGTKMTHIPYKSAADITRELQVGTVHVGIMQLEAALAPVSGGRIRALAVTGSRRHKALPDVASIGEAGVKGLEGIDPYTYYALAGPARLPQAVAGRLNEAINTVSKMPDAASLVREKLFNEPATSTPDSFRKFVETDIAKWQKLRGVVKLAE